MENKIVYLKTYIITIVTLIAIFGVSIFGIVYHYEKKINEIKDSIKQVDSITIKQPESQIK